MKTRMEKYYSESDNDTLLREHKNEKLYENIGTLEVDDYKLDTNMTVLERDVQNIDVEKIKKILDTKYNKEPKRRSIIIEEAEEEAPVSLDETREYDINAILEQARSEKEVDYEKERLKKLRDTQYDILNSLEIKDDNQPQEKIPPKNEKKSDDELMDLINTITMRELEKKTNDEIDPLDILTELKGDENTVILGGAKESESLGETSPIMSLDELPKIKEEKQEVQEEKVSDFTSTLQFTQSDFDDFNDLKKEVKSSRALIYVVIILISLILIGGLIIFLNNFLNMQWF